VHHTSHNHHAATAVRLKQAFFTQLAMPALSPEDIAAVRQRFENVRTQHYPFDFGPTDHHVENRDLLLALTLIRNPPA
jgi:hypothetical protein